MGDELRFSEKWDFRRQENNFDDSSSDDPDSNSTQDPIIHNPNLVLDSHQLDDGTKTVTREQPAKTTRKRRSKKDEVKPEKAKQVRGRKPKAVSAEESKKKEENAMEMYDVGMFMKTLLDDLTASRESLMDWMNTELYGSSEQNVVSRPPPLKKRAVAAVASQRSVKKRKAKKKMEEEEKEREEQSKEDQNAQEIAQNDRNQVQELECQKIAQNGGNQVQELEYQKIAQNGRNQVQELECQKIAQNGGNKVQELECNAGQFDRFLYSGQGGLGRNYFQQQGQGQEVIVAKTEMKNEKNATLTTNQKSVVLAIEAPKLSQRQKKPREANAIKNRSSMVERTGSEAQKDDNFGIPYVPKPSSSSPPLQSFPLNSLFSSSSQGIASFASNHNFQPAVSHVPDLSEFQTGFTGGQGYKNPLIHNNSYFSGFPAAFLQPNLIPGGFNYPAQVNPAASSQQRDNGNMFGGLRMAGGAIRYSGNRFPESEVGNSNNSFSDYRTGSGR